MASTANGELASQAASRAEAVSGVAPVMDQPSNMVVAAGSTAEQTLHATDADGDSLFFSKGFGPAYMTVFDTGPGGGNATGLIHLAPSKADIGFTGASVVVTDRTFQDARSFNIQVTGDDRPPVLDMIPDMTAREGQTVDQTITATDPDDDPLTFVKLAGPGFLSVETGTPLGNVAQGNVRITPGTTDAGMSTATVEVSDGTLASQRSFAITVTENNPPFLNFINSMFVPAGSTGDQTITGTDPDNDALTFTRAAGPSFVTVTTTGRVGTLSTGNVHAFAPPPFVNQQFVVTVEASDGVFSVFQSFGLVILQPNNPPVLGPIPNVTLNEGEVLEQGVTASDPDNDFVSLSIASGPPYVSINNVSFFPTVALIRVAPGAGTAGLSPVTIQASDGHSTVTQTFFVTVLAGEFPAPCPGGTFAASTLGIGFTPQAFGVADVNGDQNPDLLGTDYNDSLSVFLGNGAGAFSQGPRVKAGYGAYYLAVADLNSDGRPDVVTANGDNTFSVLLGTAGGFAPKHDYGTGAFPTGLIVTDVNGDGKPDIVTLAYYTGVFVARGVGDGTFLAPIGFPTGQSSSIDFASGDLDGDGTPDFVVLTQGYPNGVAVNLLNDGHGTLVPSAGASVEPSTNNIALADLNEDGHLDLLSLGGSRAVSVRFGGRNGDFGSPIHFGITASGTRMTLADLNGDGHTDVAVTENSSVPAIEVLLGSGQGRLAPRTTLPVPNPPQWIVTADMDRDERPDLIASGSYTAEAYVLLNRSCAPARDIPPRVTATPFLSTTEGVAVSIPVTAIDPDGDAIGSLTADVSGLPVGNNAALTSNPAHTSGTFTWTPGFNDARPNAYVVVFRASNALTGSATARITVGNVNRAPVASAGGPYTVFVNSPLTLDGGGSSDPDGDPLTYKWVFGDGFQGTGVAPMHTYHATGSYGVAVTVSDGTLTGLATTTANVVGVIPARAFTESGNRTIKLSSGKPEWCVQLEPVGRSYSNAAVDLGSIVMKSTGTGSVSQIPALSGKAVVGSDRDGNGVQELTACFGKTDLRNLFSSVHGTQAVTVSFEGTLLSGGIFRATMDLTVNGSGGGHSASVTPNPLNPDAILTFAIERQGPVRVRLYDLNGRLVRTLLDDPSAAAGYHDLRIDGSALASGLYFYRIDTAEGRTFGKFSVLK